jgi:diamine N-acetyltransferase
MSAVQFPNIVITKATLQDAKQLTALSVATFVESFAEFNRKEDMDAYVQSEMNETRLAEELHDINSDFFFLLQDGEPVGYTKLRNKEIPPGLMKFRPLEIERIYIRKEFQGKKLGAVLMNHCIETAMDRGYDVLWLGVWEHNYKAIRFYEQWGFELFGAHDFVLGSDVQTDVLMKKEL